MNRLLSSHWHHLPEAESLELLGVDPARGLDRFEIAHRLERFGPNRPPERKGPGALARFLLQFHNALVYILIASGVITWFVKGPVDALSILAVVLANALIGFLQEESAARSLAALAGSLSAPATTLRAGATSVVPAESLVPGDVVLLQSGDKVPADLRLLEARTLRIDESPLTGESRPVEKRTGVLPGEAPLADRQNMAYGGTLVVYGTGRGVVVATGGATEVGRIAELVAGAGGGETPLARRISRLSGFLLGMILALAALLFAAGLLRGQPAAETFLAAVAMAVAAIPEGLPAAVTIVLSVGVSRMAARRAVVRKLPAVETLGGATVICSDKTGTLTENRMSAAVATAGGSRYAVSGTGYAPAGRMRREGAAEEATAGGDPALAALARAALLCNDGRLVPRGGEWLAEGDPTDAALLAFAAKAGLDRGAEDAARPRREALPFESERRFMAVSVEGPAGAELLLKGAAERLLPACAEATGADGAPVPLDRAAVEREVAALAARGMRVLAFARGARSDPAAPIADAETEAGLLFLGLVGIVDPPRPEAVAAVAACRRAGIAVKMITGDHAATAAAIAAEVGLAERGPGGEPPRALIGAEMARLSDEEFIACAGAVSVFARVSPEQKLRLVEALQARGEVVAMTGDGVNDAPALRQADIGVAMGKAGTEAAKEAADMVLVDDNFATIEAAVEEGRAVFDNLAKFIAWTLPTNIGQALVILVALLAGEALPILPAQILWINLASALFLGTGLAFEAKEPALMSRPPRRADEPILTPRVLARILWVGGLLTVGAFLTFEWELAAGAALPEARGAAVGVFIIAQACYLFSCRSFERPALRMPLSGNPALLAGVALMLLAHVAFLALPVSHRLFQVAPVRPAGWLMALLAGITVFAATEAEKRLLRPQAGRPQAPAVDGGPGGRS